MNRNEQFFDNKTQELGVTLNAVQKQAVLKTEGPLLLLASPGSGKTTTIIMRIGYLIEVKGISPHRIKAVTFSKASAIDMKERFQKFFPYLPIVDFSTIHSLAYKIIREYYAMNNIDYLLIEGDKNRSGQEKSISKNKILRQIYKEVNKEWITEDQLEELITYISYVKNKMLSRDNWDIENCKIPKKVEILEKYEAFKMSGPKIYLDFDDMLIRANQILNVNQQMLRKYQEQFDYVLTDESQDTSLVQHSIIEKLVEQHHNLCVVADEDQSIYGWRGADPGYLLDFKKVYPEAEILMMVQNYRSSKDIVAIANQFIKQNKHRYDKNMVTENPSYTPILLRTLDSYHLQQQYLVDRILAENTFSNTAILYRNNSSVISIMDWFDRHHIPFYMKDVENKFFKHWIVEDILNFMRLSFNETRIDIFEKIYLKTDAYLSKVQFAQLTILHKNDSVFDCLLNGNILKDYQKDKIVLQQKIVKKLKEVQPKVAIEKIRHQLGYEKMLKSRAEKFGYNFDTLLDILNTLEMIADPLESIIVFAHRLQHLESVAAASKGNKETNAVTFSTMHSSKGLEFDTVFIIDLIDGVLPSVKLEEDTIEEYEEEIRLFYVAVTRAISNLELITYTSRFNYKVMPSKFFIDIKQLLNPKKKDVPIKNKPLKQETQISPNAIQDLSTFKKGLSIRHRVFGMGVIQACIGGVITIQFEKELKKFDISTCIKYGLLEKTEL